MKKTLYILNLNKMTDHKSESLSSVAMSFDRQKLIDFYNSQLVETYHEEKGYIKGYWAKNFKKHGPLEWYNLVYSFDYEGVITERESYEIDDVIIIAE